jgi:hypothetical protein
MGNQFQWHTDEEFDPPPDPSPQRPHRSWEIAGFWLSTAVIIIVLAGGWLFTQRRLAQADDDIRASLQTLLDVRQDAFLSGDGDLFFTTFTADPAWQAAQLLPFNQTAHRAGLTITRVESNEDVVWANATWRESGETLQRLLFFEKRNGRYQQIATDPDYWGSLSNTPTNWGRIRSYKPDEDWLPEINSFVETACAGECEPFTLILANNYAETAVSDSIQVPSPRIFAVGVDGDPAPAYWEMLKQRLTAKLNPAVIRIALPPQTLLTPHIFAYQHLAAQFMAENPDIRLDLVILDEIPTEPGQLAGFDGAAFLPTAAMITAGEVYDLTPLVNTDASFAQGDFYEQIWQGAWWRERMWFMPQAAGMHLLFYDKAFYELADLAEPSLRWTWQEMGDDLTALKAPVTAVDSPLQYTTFLDADRDALYSYAYNWQTECPEAVTVRCQTALTPVRVTAALDWYRQLARPSAVMPILPVDSTSARWNWKAAVRVEAPVYYEHFLQLAQMGVAPFPGSDRFDGITPLWLEGSFITQHSKNPLAVWRWLTFLSHQPPLASFRLIPARPSVAEAASYWQILPRPLNEAMRTAFPFSRPILLGDRLVFTDEMVTAVLRGDISPEEAARQRTETIWFSNASKSSES